VHYVETTDGARGWRPHTDGVDRPGRVSTWVPLADATVSNGCICVVPLTHDVNEALERYRAGTPTLADTQHLLQHVRPLPAAAGSVLCWNFDLLHWGSLSYGATGPRVSVAYEWIRPAEAPAEDEVPLMDLGSGLPAFKDRLAVIARAVLMYEGFDPGVVPFREVAQGLVR
jgi:hypothetical protein